jgi:hypothetical protein
MLKINGVKREKIHILNFHLFSDERSEKIRRGACEDNENTTKLGILVDKQNLECYNESTIKLGKGEVMENNKILEAARKNKNRGKEYENKESVRSNLLGSMVAILIGITLFLIEYFVQNSINVSLIIVGMTAACIQSLYEGVKNKKVYLIIIGVFETLVVIFGLFVFIAQVVLK